MGERVGGEETKERERCQFVDRLHLASHPPAGFLELFAFGNALLRLLHVILSPQHAPLNVVHQRPLQEEQGHNH